ncbi:MAG: sulfonate transporter [Candidatus Lloydbacteria bacterium RIFCSPLOWO2_01_FULL_50_20]|uniref:Probable membrane transporter protein n=1 Tax=Candidatus Lloydbacteria bacterium RIFCSPLOWO2_01_FULL_50_20 TaxID=1798665 RepID=A0A1G2DH52_9BACT|nr:MAG: sulfonate transporter [Candidatus Lloydbacteria bacterium RIFCSPLOWO2_01_FULL_50_20]
MEYAFLVIAYVAEVVGTFAGFGSSTIALPLALFFFDFQTALVLVAVLHIFGNIGRVSFFKFGLDKSILLRFGLPSIIATLLGAMLVSYISQELLKGILGLFLVMYSIISWKKLLLLKPTTSTAFMGGGISGFFAGLIGTGGALRGAFLAVFGLPKEKYIATAAAIALAVDVTRLPVYFAEGFLTARYYWMIPVLFVVALLGSLTGKQVVSRISQEKFHHIVLAAIFLMGLTFLYSWLI